MHGSLAVPRPWRASIVSRIADRIGAAALDWPRIGRAYALAVLTALALMWAHVGWAAALLAGAAGALFVAWRTVAGVVAGFAVFCGAAAAAWPAAGAGTLGGLASWAPWAIALEAYGLVTLVTVALLRNPPRVSRQLLHSFLSSTGIGLVGVALCGSPATQSAGSVLLTGMLVYRLGAAPAYAWLPLLLRHAHRGVKAIGIAGMLIAAAVLIRLWPLLPERAAATVVLAALPAATIPWSAWNAWQNREKNPSCSRTHVVVIVLSLGLLVVAARLGL